MKALFKKKKTTENSHMVKGWKKEPVLWEGRASWNKSSAVKKE